LLDLGRLEAGVSPLEQQPIDLRKLLNRAVRAVESRMQSKGISIQMDVASMQAQGDPERLLQAFMNILDNAIKHSVPDTTVFVAGRLQNSDAIITIRDQGPGISEAALPHIFEQFYTADPSRQGSGTGLGLAIARRIVEAHAGTITAISPPGKGATFRIKLPCTHSVTAAKVN
jgi:signal transduction histidine kinase